MESMQNSSPRAHISVTPPTSHTTLTLTINPPSLHPKPTPISTATTHHKHPHTSPIHQPKLQPSTLKKNSHEPQQSRPKAANHHQPSQHHQPSPSDLPWKPPGLHATTTMSSSPTLTPNLTTITTTTTNLTGSRHAHHHVHPTTITPPSTACPSTLQEKMMWWERMAKCPQMSADREE